MILNLKMDKIHAIIAIDQQGGIGKDGALPWKSKDELSIFRTKTLNSRLLFGRKTAENIPLLKDREVFILSREISINNKNIVNSVEAALETIQRPFFVCGGAEVYREFLNRKLIDTVHLSIMNFISDSDTFLDIIELIRKDFIIVERTVKETFTHYVLEKRKIAELNYLNLLENVLNNGERRETRNGYTLSCFTGNMTFDLREGFPLLTSKKMFLRGIIEELIFFLRGETNTSILLGKNVNIWTGNTTKAFLESKGLPYNEGVMGPMYGYQWRHFGEPYLIDKMGIPIKVKGGVDQLRNVINLINTDPFSRRIIMTTYNPSQAEEGVLYPCHSLILQFYVSGNYLDMFCYNRSQDLFLGTPWNIASSSILLMIIAKITGKIARNITIAMGDYHIYEEHIEQVKIQLSRLCYRLPTLNITKNISSIEDIEELTSHDFDLENYMCNPSISAKMIA